VAISVAGIVGGLILGAYTGFTRGFFLEINKSAQVSQMSLSKKQIDKTIENIAQVASMEETRIDYKMIDSPLLHTLKFNNGALYNDSSIIAKDLSTFKFTMVGSVVLSWEAQLGSGWIGGAGEVKF
jgi:hypothetical protein